MTESQIPESIYTYQNRTEVQWRIRAGELISYKVGFTLSEVEVYEQPSRRLVNQCVEKSSFTLYRF
jgi:hypothetical protein